MRDTILTCEKPKMLGVLLLSLSLAGCHGATSSPKPTPEQNGREAAAAPAAQQEAPTQEEIARDEADRGYKVQRGQYNNYEYGYTVLIPEGYVGVYSPSPAPQHGFGITLSKRPEARIWVDGSYARVTALRRDTLEGAVDDYLSRLKEDGAITELEVLRREPTNLQSLPAVRVTARYRNPPAGDAAIQDLIIAVRREKTDDVDDDIEIIYTIGLLAPESRYSIDKEVFERVVEGWKSKPLGQ